MKPRVSILGCGWLGEALAKYLLEKEYEIKGSTTSKEKLKRLKSLGINPFILDLDKKQLNDDFLNSDILIISVAYKSVEGFKKLISLIEKSPVTKLVFISSTSVYYNTNSDVTEESDVKACPLSKIESLLISNTKFKTTVIRFGGLIGYDRKPGNFFSNSKAIDQPNGFVNMIHRDDCIQIIEQIIDKGIWDQTLNACADGHPTRREFYTKAATEIGKDIPEFNEKSIHAFKIISNQKLKTLLDYKFKFPDLYFN